MLKVYFYPSAGKLEKKKKNSPPPASRMPVMVKDEGRKCDVRSNAKEGVYIDIIRSGTSNKRVKKRSTRNK